jgi:hypothetical protein
MKLLSRNPAAIHIINAHFNKMFIFDLLSNSAAYHLIKEKLDDIDSFNDEDWYNVCKNTDSRVIEILEKNFDKIPYYRMSTLSQNPGIFTYDYEYIKEKNKEITKGIIEYYMHPDRIDKWIYELDD